LRTPSSVHDFTPHFFPVDLGAFGRSRANTDLMTFHAKNGHGDVFADMKRLANASRKNEHLNFPCLRNRVKKRSRDARREVPE
jgi:hypothetical protein